MSQYQKPMRKTDKKLDNALIKSLTCLCEDMLEQIDGFQWLTHTVRYPNVASSLHVICVFDTNDRLALFLSSDEKSKIEARIIKLLADLKITLNSPSKQLVFDAEENCTQFNKGNWAERLVQS